jgi:hypothetical protein
MLKRLLTLSILLTLGSSQAQTLKPWTVLVYINADHNLDPSAVADVKEMKAAGVSPEGGMNVVLQWDRGGRGMGANKGITREIIRGSSSEVLAQGSDDDAAWDSDNPKTLQNFLEWGMKAYPAQHYAVIMWDHGGQWTGGFGGDENRPAGATGGGLTTKDMRTAFKGALTTTGVNKFDVLSFDTCLMGGLELLLEYGDLTKMYMANPEIDYGDGLEYAATLKYLQANPSASLAGFAKTEAQIWAGHHNQGDADKRYRSHSWYDTDPAKLSTLKNAVNTFAKAFGSSASRFQARHKAIEYSFSGDATDVSAVRDFADLGDLANQAKALDPSLASSADALNAAIGAVVIEKILGSANTRAKGLSVWLPNDRKSSTLDNDYLKTFGDLQSATGVSAWKDMLPTWFAGIQGNTTAPSVAPAPAPAPSSDGGIAYSFTVDDGAANDVASVYALLANSDGELYGHILLEEAPEGNTFGGTWDKKWWQAKGKGGEVFISGLQLDPEEPTLYIPVLYTFKGETEQNEGTLLLDPETGEVDGLLDDNPKAPREVDFEDIDTLEFLALQLQGNTGEIKTASTGMKFPLEGLKLELAPLNDPKAVIIGGAADWAGNDASVSLAAK